MKPDRRRPTVYIPSKIFLSIIGLTYAGFTLAERGVTFLALDQDGVAEIWSWLMTFACVASLLTISAGHIRPLWYTTLIKGTLWIFLAQSLIRHDLFSIPVVVAPVYALFSLYLTWSLRKHPG